MFHIMEDVDIPKTRFRFQKGSVSPLDWITHNSRFIVDDDSDCLKSCQRQKRTRLEWSEQPTNTAKHSRARHSRTLKEVKPTVLNRMANRLASGSNDEPANCGVDTRHHGMSVLVPVGIDTLAQLPGDDPDHLNLTGANLLTTWTSDVGIARSIPCETFNPNYGCPTSCALDDINLSSKGGSLATEFVSTPNEERLPVIDGDGATFGTAPIPSPLSVVGMSYVQPVQAVQYPGAVCFPQKIGTDLNRVSLDMADSSTPLPPWHMGGRPNGNMIYPSVSWETSQGAFSLADPINVSVTAQYLPRNRAAHGQLQGLGINFANNNHFHPESVTAAETASFVSTHRPTELYRTPEECADMIISNDSAASCSFPMQQDEQIDLSDWIEVQDEVTDEHDSSPSSPYDSNMEVIQQTQTPDQHSTETSHPAGRANNTESEARASISSTSKPIASASPSSITNDSHTAATHVDNEFDLQTERRNAFLIECKRRGMSYKEIKRLGGFREAESTLRGRFRTLTKTKQERVRKPKWHERDIELLCHAVHKYACSNLCRRSTEHEEERDHDHDHGHDHDHSESSSPSSSFSSSASSSSSTSRSTRRSSFSTSSRHHHQYHTHCLLNKTNSKMTIAPPKVSWKKVGQYISAHGGSYQFGNATCKKKWCEVHGIQS